MSTLLRATPPARRPSHRRASIVAVASLTATALLCAAPILAADAGPQPSSAEIPAEIPARVEADLVADVGRVLSNHRFDDVFDWIEARVDGDTVYLSGAVLQPWKRDSLNRRIEALSGAPRVVDEIEVLPVSAFDDRIRYQVARSIYGSHAFFDRGYRASPPIHILVDRGRIRLEGVVRNEAERMLARSLASRSPLSIGKIENNLQLASELAR
ncbi:MAG: BON domain-containing protein [Acidobacteria bacterium]|nr:MAG: BON domain-containing protein [Acidobacteriota bacterium]REK06336.1 MAG: BON domain-containing protein [Acidobacteriota bacterium]